jgi:hypothetical protein
MFKRAFGLAAFGLLPTILLVSSCGVGSHSSVLIPAGYQGVVHGGQQPVSIAAIQLYAVGVTGDGSAATPLLSPAAITDQNGGFNITKTYACPSASALVYIVATGGNPGLGTGTNPNLALMAALGQCGNLSASTFIVINELTTVAAVYPLAPFISSPSAVGSAASDAPSLAAAFSIASELVDTSTGAAPGPGVPTGTSVPIAQINTIGNILAACINSAGGVSGDNSACGNLFSLTTSTGLTPATDTITALLHLANNPALNTGPLYSMVTPRAPFQPSQVQTPPDLAVRLAVPSGFTQSPATLNFPATRVGSTSAVQTVTFTNNTAMAIGIDAPAVSAANGGISGDDAGDFRLSAATQASCPTPVLPGATCTVQIVFAPTATGTRDGYYMANNTSANPVLSVPLTGVGLEANAGPATLSSSSSNLTAAGTPTNVTFTNSGSTVLTIDSITISNDPTSGQPAFTQTNNCGASLAPLANCTIAVSALATSQAYSTGVLTVADDAAFGPQTMNLSYSNGFVGQVLINFLSRSVGTQMAQFVNNIPGYPAPTDTFTIGGVDAADFTVTNSPPNQTCNPSRFFPTCAAQVTFAPTALGLRTATLYVNGSPFGGVIGIGLPAGIQFATAFNGVPNAVPLNSINFNTVVVGQTSSNNTVTINNTGTLPVTINAPVLSGPNASDFHVVSSCTSPVAPNGTCGLVVTASPSQATNRSAILTVTDSTAAVQQTITLTVLGVNPSPSAIPNSLTFPYTPAGTVSASQTFTVTSYNNDAISVAIEDAGAVPFVLTQASSCAQTPCQISVAYAPSGSGTSFGNILIKDLFSGQGFTVSVMGTSVPPQ